MDIEITRIPPATTFEAHALEPRHALAHPRLEIVTEEGSVTFEILSHAECRELMSAVTGVMVKLAARNAEVGKPDDPAWVSGTEKLMRAAGLDPEPIIRTMRAGFYSRG